MTGIKDCLKSWIIYKSVYRQGTKGTAKKCFVHNGTFQVGVFWHQGQSHSLEYWNNILDLHIDEHKNQ